MLFEWEGNRSSGVILGMRHGLSGLSTYGLNGHRQGDEHPAYAPVGYGTFTFTFTWSETNSTDRNLFFFRKAAFSRLWQTKMHGCWHYKRCSFHIILRLFTCCRLTEPVVHCRALETTYSELNSTDTEFGVTVNISCLPGYRINAQTTATVHCTSTGHWSLNDTCLRTLYQNQTTSCFQ